MRIPKTLEIAGKTIEVQTNGKFCEEQRIYGEALCDLNLIVLASARVNMYHPQKIEETFIHECLHIIYNTLGLKDWSNEKVIKPVSELLYQVFRQIEDKPQRKRKKKRKKKK